MHDFIRNTTIKPSNNTIGLITIILTFVISGCEDIENSSWQDKAQWEKQEDFTEFSSTVYTAKAFDDFLFLQSFYEVSKMDKDDNVVHYNSLHFYDSLQAIGDIGNKYFAATFGNLSGFNFYSVTEPYDDKSSLVNYAWFESESWLSKVGNKGTIIGPAPKSYGGSSRFGVFNSMDELATLVYVPEQTACYVVIVESAQDPYSGYYEINFKSITETSNPCYDGTLGHAVYATNGTDFFAGTINNGAFSVSSAGDVKKIYEGRVSNLFYHSSGKLFLQSDYTLLVSQDEGNTWKVVWNDTPTYHLNFADIDGGIYFFRNKQIFKVLLTDEKIEITELDNSGLSDIENSISSMVLFNGKVYVTTTGNGIFYKDLKYFDSTTK